MSVATNEFSFVNERGQRLFALEVLPARGKARAVCVWAHGHGEHCRRKLKGALRLGGAGASFGFIARPHRLAVSKPPKKPTSVPSVGRAGRGRVCL
jgi:hypothetical protein